MLSVALRSLRMQKAPSRGTERNFYLPWTKAPGHTGTHTNTQIHTHTHTNIHKHTHTHTHTNTHNNWILADEDSTHNQRWNICVKMGLQNGSLGLGHHCPGPHLTIVTVVWQSRSPNQLCENLFGLGSWACLMCTHSHAILASYYFALSKKICYTLKYYFEMFYGYFSAGLKM